MNLVSRLIEGQFPNVRNFIPKSYATKVVVARQAFADAIRRVSLFARESANVVRLEIEAGENGENGEGLNPGRLMIEAQAQDLGESHDELDASIEGESTHLAFNAEYLNEFANALAGGTIDPETDKLKEIDEVVVEITGPLSPGVVRRAAACPTTSTSSCPCTPSADPLSLVASPPWLLLIGGRYSLKHVGASPWGRPT